MLILMQGVVRVAQLEADYSVRRVFNRFLCLQYEALLKEAQKPAKKKKIKDGEEGEDLPKAQGVSGKHMKELLEKHGYEVVVK